MPTIPYMYLLAGLSMQWFFKRFGKLIIAFILFNGIYEICLFLYYNTQCGIAFLPIKYISETDPNPHSVYQFGQYDFPIYSWLHVNNETERVRIYLADRDPKFVRQEAQTKKGNSDQQLCAALVLSIVKDKEYRPKYVMIHKYGGDHNKFKFPDC